jgi:hypothetical protein
MVSLIDEGSPFCFVVDADCGPAELLQRIGEFFSRWGIFGHSLSLEYEGNRYRVSCDEEAFIVYRVNSGTPVKHHVPGWPVCLVNSETIFEEHSSPGLGDDHCACGADIGEWLKIIDLHNRADFGE